jgi:integrase
MPLTDTAIRAAQPGPKPIKLSDSGGLYLEVSPSGGKWWRLKYRFQGKEKRLSLGVYPAVPLVGRKDKSTGEWIAGARDKREEAKRLLGMGIDPGAQRKAAKATAAEASAQSLEAVAHEWLAKFSVKWTPSYRNKLQRSFELNVFPWLGTRPIGEISAVDVLQCLDRIQGRGALETAHRVRQTCAQLFRYAMATQRATRNPASELRGALPQVEPTHFAAITEPSQIGGLLRAVEGYQGQLVTRAALKLAALVFIRPGELRKAEWAEFDLVGAQWSVPAERMKRKEDHIVPLCAQAVAILRDLQPLTGRGRYVFPSVRSIKRPMSGNTVNGAFRRMGFGKDEMCGHGFRAMARTVMDQVLGIRPDIIEHQLAHKVKGPLGRAYNRTSFLPERRLMMQQWADYLDLLRASHGVVAPTLHAPGLPASITSVADGAA